MSLVISSGVVLKQPTGASWTITPTSLLPDDADAVAYIAAVEAADGEALEPAVKLAINSFVKGCKQDGIWPAIKASCILAGARTLNGALVPLVGAAPTNYNFVAGDYNRKTGLVGDGSTKYLNSNRNNSTDPQDSKHGAVYATTATTSTATIGPNWYPAYISAGEANVGAFNFGRMLGNGALYFRCNRGGGPNNLSPGSAVGLIGANRASSGSYTARYGGAITVISAASEVPFNGALGVFGDPVGLYNYCNARLAFYSIGESLDLAKLDGRVTALVNALGTAIP